MDCDMPGGSRRPGDPSRAVERDGVRRKKVENFQHRFRFAGGILFCGNVMQCVFQGGLDQQRYDPAICPLKILVWKKFVLTFCF